MLFEGEWKGWLTGEGSCDLQAASWSDEQLCFLRYPSENMASKSCSLFASGFSNLQRHRYDVGESSLHLGNPSIHE